MDYIEYFTTELDRLDRIAAKAYGDSFKVGEIIEANPTLPIQAVYESGIKILLPIIKTASTTVQTQILPPWKR